MLEWFYLTGWGAFSMMLFLFIPFFLVFLYIVFRKSLKDSSPSQAAREKYVRLERMWIGLVLVVFIGVNLASIGFMPTVITANASVNAKKILNVTVEAQSWSYDISEQTYEVGRPVRFLGKSLDTMHSFAVYDPNGKVLFTMMLMPGLPQPTSLVYTFTKPGTYKVRCLEYCGASHHNMNDEIVVVARKS